MFHSLQLYRALAALPAPELEATRKLLAASPCIWVGNGFAPIGRVAFR